MTVPMLQSHPLLPAAPRPPTTEPTPDWRYEMRREAQLILPGLYLGPSQASLNPDRMKAAGITHVLCVRDKREAWFMFPRFPGQFAYMTLDIGDAIEHNIITSFPRCMAFIDEAIASGGTVLVHCNSGISLSPAIVIGYLMWKLNWSSDAAQRHVMSKRYCIAPGPLLNQLKEYESIYVAQKLHALQGQQAWDGGCSTARRKRQVEDGYPEQEHDNAKRYCCP